MLIVVMLVSRYVLADQYLRFYFRFVRPHLDLLAQRLYDQVWDRISEQLRAFIGMTVFEELCREWVLAQARAGQLPFAIEQVGTHWGGSVQVDVVAINWRENALLLGEAKWGTDPVGRDVVRGLIANKTPQVFKTLPDAGEGWTVHYAFFARAGFTDACAGRSVPALLLPLCAPQPRPPGPTALRPSVGPYQRAIAGLYWDDRL